MPKMDGNELTRILKNDEKTSHIPIILLTAKSGQENKLEGLQTGGDDYLTKPFDVKELQIRIENLIKIRKNLQEKYSKEDSLSVKEDKKLRSIDEKFLNKVLEVIEDHIGEEEFSIEEFGREIGMSRTQVHRKLKALVGKSASQYIRSIRLAKAKKMIEEEKGNISEIAYSMDFRVLHILQGALRKNLVIRQVIWLIENCFSNLPNPPKIISKKLQNYLIYAYAT